MNQQYPIKYPLQKLRSNKLLNSFLISEIATFYIHRKPRIILFGDDNHHDPCLIFMLTEIYYGHFVLL